MKIESIIKRASGSSVTLGDKTYRFDPSENHVCEVEDEIHVERLLSIKEGFREAFDEATKPEATNKRGGRKAKIASGIDVKPV